MISLDLLQHNWLELKTNTNTRVDTKNNGKSNNSKQIVKLKEEV